ncbi:FIG00772381: hypothetical protein [hydrothermal vent metagenome]|uniref:Uncharacterized protein n=1 Tax=hydrothermal vent metagenome TaxID=652676 RepID=A0A3B0ZVU6_9ZZZZ
MKKYFPIVLLSLLPVMSSADLALPPPMNAVEIQLSKSGAQLIGEKIWQNEGAGKHENLIVWNEGEDFPSLGIGHFIWYPAGFEGPFVESFPALLKHLRKEVATPDWLNGVDDAPWSNRTEFYRDIDSWRMAELRDLMKSTMPQQVAFIVLRLEAALPKMLATLAIEQQRSHVEQQFYRVAKSPNGIYALIDYVNFKGEGISPGERYRGEGWGLLQVLEGMRAEDGEVMDAFARSADAVLTRRVMSGAGQLVGECA